MDMLFSNKDPLQDLREKWLIAVSLKILFCILSLKTILDLKIWNFVLIGFLPLLERFAIVGFLLPLMVMCWYIWYSYKEVKSHPEIRKTAGDSAYFLGFLFTIASIIAAMGDIALSDMRQETMTYVASRFALAMITTLLGMVYRTYLTEFEQDAAARSSGGGNQDISVVIRAMMEDDSPFQRLQNSMNQAIQNFEEIAHNASAIADTMAAAVQNLVEETGKKLDVSIVKLMEDSAKNIQNSALQMNTEITTAYKNQQEAINTIQRGSIDQLQSQLESMKAEYKSWNEETKMVHSRVKKRSDDLDIALGKFATGFENISGNVSGIQTSLQEEIRIIETNLEKLHQLSQVFDNGSKTYDDIHKLHDGLEKTFDVVQDLPQITNNLKSSALQFNESLSTLNKDMAQVTGDLCASTKKYMDLKNSVKKPGVLSRFKFW